MYLNLKSYKYGVQTVHFSSNRFCLFPSSNGAQMFTTCISDVFKRFCFGVAGKLRRVYSRCLNKKHFKLNGFKQKTFKDISFFLVSRIFETFLVTEILLLYK